MNARSDSRPTPAPGLGIRSGVGGFAADRFPWESRLSLPALCDVPLPVERRTIPLTPRRLTPAGGY
jgi:hypothetical protein